jgi:SnoaL-like polyketide cyclase
VHVDVRLLEPGRWYFYGVAGTIRDAITDDNVVAQEIHWHGTQTGPLETPAGTVEASGKPVSVDASIWFRFQGETIGEIHHYLDVATLLEQIGAR